MKLPMQRLMIRAKGRRLESSGDQAIVPVTADLYTAHIQRALPRALTFRGGQRQHKATHALLDHGKEIYLGTEQECVSRFLA